MIARLLFLSLCAKAALALPDPRRLQDDAPPPLWRKLQAKMNMEFCSKNTASELEPCKSEVFQESLKGLSLEEKKSKVFPTWNSGVGADQRSICYSQRLSSVSGQIDAAISELETRKKKKIAMIIHEDSKTMYDEFCAKDGPKANSEICTNNELSAYLNSPLQLPGKRSA
jgi:hypothetical protein